MKRKPTRADYDCFRWLPIERWNMDTLMGPTLGPNIFCKICDTYISGWEAEKHINRHVSTRKKQLADDKKKAAALRLEKAREARALKAQEKAEELKTKKGE